MHVSSIRHNRIFFLGLLLVFGATTDLHAADNNLIASISPLITINKPSSEGTFQALEVSKKAPSPYQSGSAANTPPLKKSMGDQDPVSLALGARFQVSEWLGLGAVCTMPFTEEEAINSEDLAIEAMVTMQF